MARIARAGDRHAGYLRDRNVLADGDVPYGQLALAVFAGGTIGDRLGVSRRGNVARKSVVSCPGWSVASAILAISADRMAVGRTCRRNAFDGSSLAGRIL